MIGALGQTALNVGRFIASNPKVAGGIAGAFVGSSIGQTKKGQKGGPLLTAGLALAGAGASLATGGIGFAGGSLLGLAAERTLQSLSSKDMSPEEAAIQKGMEKIVKKATQEIVKSTGRVANDLLGA